MSEYTKRDIPGGVAVFIASLVLSYFLLSFFKGPQEVLRDAEGGYLIEWRGSMPLDHKAFLQGIESRRDTIVEYGGETYHLKHVWGYY